MNGDSMDLICYKYDGWQPRIRPGSPRRQWMDDTNERYAYRCLPLTIANSHGWELLCPMAFEARWDGDINMESVQIRMDRGYSQHLAPVSIFGYGTLTWHVEAIFRTPPGWNLYVSGPPNRQKDAIQPLGGMIETDWSPYTFTMNWRFTRANQWVRFEESEPIAFFFPVERGRTEQFRPRIERLEDKPELREAFEKWSASRNAFQQRIQEENPAAPADKWQKLYFRGLDQDGKPAPVQHQSKLRLPPFVFPDGQVMDPPEEKKCPVRHAPEPLPQAPAFSLEAKPAPANALLNPAGGAAAGAANPALALALGRIGFDAPTQRSPQQAPPQQQPVQFQVPARPDRVTQVALKRRDWIMGAQARQYLLSPRNHRVQRVRDLAGDDFLDFHYALSRPVVIAGAMEGWPALERWTADYLAERIGPAPVQCQAGRDGDPDYELHQDALRQAMPFDRFIAQVAPPAFGNDVCMTAADGLANRAALAPLEADLGTLGQYLSSAQGRMAIGAAGMFTPLQFDLANNLVAQLAGASHLLLAPPSETHRLYHQRHVFSALRDLTDEAQLNLHPLARGAQTFEVELEAGDLLFVPVGWWRQSIAVDFSVTMTYADFRWPGPDARNYPAD